jgi:hypothetical protein
MDRKVAQDCIARELQALQQLSYVELLQFVGHPQSKWTTGTDQKKYQLEIQAFWDNGTVNGNLRVMVSAEYGAWSAFAPLTDDFIIAPNGSLL